LIKDRYFQVAQDPESRQQYVKPRLDIEKNIDRTGVVGIFEIGGIDTTTIAKTFYNSIASLTEGSCSLENIRETSDQKGLIHLQNSLMFQFDGFS
jgi:hypothetical protein